MPGSTRFFPTVLNASRFRGKENENLLTPFVVFRVNVALQQWWTIGLPTRGAEGAADGEGWCQRVE